jgi:hypothetical protein
MVDVIEVQNRPVETVTPLTFREAVRLGRLIAPNPTEGWGYGQNACVLRAAYLGAGSGPTDYNEYGALLARFTALRQPATCPLPHEPGSLLPPKDVLDLTWHLNDDHGWSDEEICDWLEGLGL